MKEPKPQHPKEFVPNWFELSREEKRVYRKAHRELMDEWFKRNSFNRKDFTRLRCYVLLARSKKTNELMGQVENSFSMGWSKTHVRVCRPYMGYDFDANFDKHKYNKACSDVAKGLERSAKELSKRYPGSDIFVARIGSKNCPVEIDWNAFYNRTENTNYTWRNLPFKVKEQSVTGV